MNWSIGESRYFIGDKHFGQSHLKYCVGDDGAFLQKFAAREAEIFRGVALDRFERVASQSQIENLISGTLIRSDQARVVEHGYAVPREDISTSTTIAQTAVLGTLNAGLALSRFAKGATLVFDDVNKYVPSVGLFAKGIGRRLGYPTQASVYITPPLARGLSPHKDREHVLLLQLSGSKHWVVGEPEKPYVDATLNPGDALFIPAQTLHSATSGPTHTSIHITFGVAEYTATQIMGDLIKHRMPNDADRGITWHEAVAAVAEYCRGESYPFSEAREEVLARMLNELAVDYSDDKDFSARFPITTLDALSSINADTQLRCRDHAIIEFRRAAEDQIQMIFGRKLLTIPFAPGERISRLAPECFKLSSAIGAAARTSGDKIALSLVTEGVAEPLDV